ncbi:MAG: PPM-type phosphatase protein [Ignavibacteria bacterium]|nr:PPM-type phosphatase protein [Ignavibacteria bacterium]
MTKKIINLDSLIDFSANLNEYNDEKAILNVTLLSIMGKLKSLRGCVLLPKKNDTYKIIITKGKKILDTVPQFPIKYFHSIDKLEKSEKILYSLGFRFFIPIIYQQNLISVICISKKSDNKRISPIEKKYVNLIGAICANAIVNAGNRQLLIKTKNSVERRNQLLTTLFELGRNFSGFLSREQILKMLSLHLMGQLTVSRFAVIIRYGSCEFEAIFNRLSELPPVSVTNDLFDIKKTIRLRDLKTCCELEEYLLKVEARIISPMTVQGEVKGLLIIGKKMNSESFSDEDIHFIEAIGNTAMASFETERLFREELTKKNLEKEIDIALKIQTNLLPKTNPVIKNFDIAGINIQSKKVGGDYYDFIDLPSGKLLIVVADVSGKGIPAALLMANLQAALRVLSSMELPLDELARRLNSVIYRNTAPEDFVTMFIAELDYKNSIIRYLNAGHNPPFMITKTGKSHILPEGGIILGALDNEYPYPVVNFKLKQGEIIFIFTDGLTEGTDKSGMVFGERKIVEILKKNRSKNAMSILEEILSECRLQSTGDVQYDDITCVLIKCSN